MNIGADRRLALIVATGLFFCAAGPLHAVEGDAQGAAQPTAVGSAADIADAPAKATRHRSHKSAAKARKPDRSAAQKTTDSQAKADDAKADQAKAEQAKAETAQAPDAARPDQAGIPANVANANAQWPADAAPVANAAAPSVTSSAAEQTSQQDQPATASPANAASADVVAGDQLNELDLAIAEDHKPPLTLAKATIDPTAQEKVESDHSTWDQTSLIGKIFIAFGGLLTMASAVRMFIA